MFMFKDGIHVFVDSKPLEANKKKEHCGKSTAISPTPGTVCVICTCGLILFTVDESESTQPHTHTRV